MDGPETQSELVRLFAETSDTESRMAAIKQALEGLSGTAEPRVSNSPTYTVVREAGLRART